MIPLLIHPDHVAAALDLHIKAADKAGLRSLIQDAPRADAAEAADGRPWWYGDRQIGNYTHELSPGLVELRLDGGVINIPVGYDILTEWYVSPRHVIEAVSNIKADPSIKGVLLTINSPGGTVVGTAEMARAINSLAAEKPVICVVDEMAASAGYWPAAASGNIYATPSADIGSVGVYALHLNLAKTYEKIYASDLTLIRNGERKAESLREMTPEMQEAWQAEVDMIADKFRAAVRSFRGTDIADEHLQGHCLSGEAALSAGLVDFVSDDPRTQALADLQSLIDTL